jgi:hypothetical protein
VSDFARQHGTSIKQEHDKKEAKKLEEIRAEEVSELIVDF